MNFTYKHIALNALTLFPSLYCPPIAYFAEIAKYDAIVVEQFETFPKQTYRNRTVILSANAKLPLIVPVVHTNGNHTMTKDIGISYAEPWNIKHWRAIESAYNSSPYFLYYKDYLNKILHAEHARLIELNDLLLKFFLRRLNINTQISYSKDFTPYQSMDVTDYRDSFSPKSPYTALSFPSYSQVFDSKLPFYPNLSILDLLFNLGPDAASYIHTI